MLVFGTRPEAIKMCPLVKEFQKYPEQFETIVCVTGQHREMLDQVLKIFEVKPDMVLIHGDTTTSTAAALAAFYQQIPVGHIEAGLRTHNIYSPKKDYFNTHTIN